MVMVPLIGGAYEARSIIANAQRCVNLYPERNPSALTKDGDSAAPTTHYPTPGLLALARGNINAPVRGLYLASNGLLYAVIGAVAYAVTSSWQLVQLGTLLSQSTPVSMADNGTTLVIVDGTSAGYEVNLATNVMTAIADATGAFVGANRVEYLDTFLLFNEPDGSEFYSTHSNSTTFDPLYYAQKSGGSDLLVTHAVVHKMIWLLGTLTSEVWYNAGGALFPFAAVPGAFVSHGCAAPYSVAVADESLFWLGQERQGQGIVYMSQGYKALRISTHAIEAEFQNYTTLADARAFTYQSGGHFFYVLNFPTADKTWVYDMATGAWHERAWTDENGALHRHRAVCHAFAYGVHVVGDHSNGTLYAMDDDLYTDNGSPIQRIRSFPHLIADGKRVSYMRFVADMECGNALTSDVEIALRWSDTRGRTWGNPVTQTLGATGAYEVQPQWRRLGMARDRVFELRWSAPIKTALNGAFIDSMVHGT